MTLVERGADIHKKSPEGKTCLWLAVNSDDLISIAKLFLKLGAKVNEKSNDLKTVIFDYANWRMLQILLEHGADLNVMDKNNDTPLTCAESGGSKFVMVQEIAKMKFAKQNINSKNLEFIKRNPKIHSSYRNFLKELKKMENFKLYNGLSFYDILQMRNHIKQLALLTKNEDFVSAFQSSNYSKKFPYYEEDLRRTFTEAQERENAVEAEQKNIYESGLQKEFSLPPEIMKIIVDFATDYLYYEKGWRWIRTIDFDSDSMYGYTFSSLSESENSSDRDLEESEDSDAFWSW